MTNLDLTKYEGHTPKERWKWLRGYMTSGLSNTLPADLLGLGPNIDRAVLWADGDIVSFNNEADKALIADSPLLLEAYKEKCAEVDRLRAAITRIVEASDLPAMDFPDAVWEAIEAAEKLLKEAKP